MAKVEIAGAPPEHLAKLLAIGVFQSVTVNFNKEEFSPAPEQLGQIEERWAPKAAKGYFPGPVARVTNFGVADGNLRLNLQPTTFKEFVGLQTNNDATRYGVGNLANPLSISMAVHTPDGKWLLTKKMRGDRIGSLDAVGGYLNPEKDENDPIKTAEREYGEETGCDRILIRAMILLGLGYEFKNLCHPVLSVLVETGLSSQEILDSAAKNADGEVELLAVGRPVKTMTELEDHGTEVEPDGQLTFALAVRYLADPSIFSEPRMVSTLSELKIH